MNQLYLQESSSSSSPNVSKLDSSTQTEIEENNIDEIEHIESLINDLQSDDEDNDGTDMVCLDYYFCLIDP